MERRPIRLTSVLSFILSVAVPCVCYGALSQDREPGPNNEWPQTRAERTDFRETSHYADVVQFIEDLQAKGAPISTQYIGVSTRGHKIPLVIVSRPPVSGPTGRKHASVCARGL